MIEGHKALADDGQCPRAWLAALRAQVIYVGVPGK